MKTQTNPGLIAAKAFLLPILGQTLGWFLCFYLGYLDSTVIFFLWQALFTGIAGWCILQSNDSFRIAITTRSLGLGLLFSLGTELVLLYHLRSTPTLPSGLSLISLSIYHITEFIAIALKNPQRVSIADFVLKYDFAQDRPGGLVGRVLTLLGTKTYHGFDHHLALAIVIGEFALEAFYWPEVKFGLPVISYFGFTICMIAEAIRKVAMLTAGSNFNHIVQEKRQSGHVLVTGGLYSWWRHPSYVGQYWWAIGMTVILVNPLSLIIVTVAIWLFLRKRITREETALVEFFGADYIAYRAKVPSGILGIK